jgi:hypothetical protein
MAIAELFNVSGVWLYICCGICLLPGLYFAFCFVMAISVLKRIGVFRNIAGDISLLIGFWKVIAVVFLILGMTVLASIDFGLALVFGVRYKLHNNRLLKKEPDDHMNACRLSVSPDGCVYVLKDLEQVGGHPVIHVYDDAGNFIKDYKLNEYLIRIKDDDCYRTLLSLDEAVDVHDIDVTQDGHLIILATVPQPGTMVKNEDEDDDYGDYYYSGPWDSILLKISPSGELADTIWLSNEVNDRSPRSLSVNGNSIYLGGAGRIFRLDHRGKVVAYDDLSANDGKLSTEVIVYAADDAVIAARGSVREIFLLTKDFKHVGQWRADSLCRREDTVTNICMDNKGNVFTTQSNSSLVPASQYTTKGKFKGRIGNMLFGFQALEALDIDIDKDGHLYLLNDVFNEIFVYKPG